MYFEYSNNQSARGICTDSREADIESRAETEPFAGAGMAGQVMSAH